jgi:hypothetical protein
VDPTTREEEHRKIAASHRPKQDAKRQETARKRAAKRPKTEPTDKNTVLGKRATGSRDESGAVDITITDIVSSTT